MAPFTRLIYQPRPVDLAIKTRASPAAFSTAPFSSLPFFSSPSHVPVVAARPNARLDERHPPSPGARAALVTGLKRAYRPLVGRLPCLTLPLSGRRPRPRWGAVMLAAPAADPDSSHLSIRPFSTLSRPSSTLPADGVITGCLSPCVTGVGSSPGFSLHLASSHPRRPSSTTSHRQCRLPFEAPRAKVLTCQHGDWPPHCGMTASSVCGLMQGRRERRIGRGEWENNAVVGVGGVSDAANDTNAVSPGRVHGDIGN